MEKLGNQSIFHIRRSNVQKIAGFDDRKKKKTRAPARRWQNISQAKRDAAVITDFAVLLFVAHEELDEDRVHHCKALSRIWLSSPAQKSSIYSGYQSLHKRSCYSHQLNRYFLCVTISRLETTVLSNFKGIFKCKLPIAFRTADDDDPQIECFSSLNCNPDVVLLLVELHRGCRRPVAMTIPAAVLECRHDVLGLGFALVSLPMG